ncbi:1401_t:CDS:2 [Acaulospora morrowiae]|uniref:1401_t:CDS:1 n=1 Tax=Acaulospora morrowiae TaxID=94023 RepID=A0A9N8ZK47_9GLOM|nr:1401_t:CDS:2 [Acaulospora morrowiae]
MSTRDEFKELDSLNEYRVKSINSAYYIKEFIDAQEEQNILDKIYSAPKPKWVTLKNRRLQNWGGIPTERGMLSEPLPSWLTNTIFPRFTKLNIFSECEKFHLPNHCLINEYLSGQGIMPHEDGPFYFPTIATVSLKSHTILCFHKHIDASSSTNQPGVNYDTPEFSLLLEPRSLLILKHDLYKKYLHGIQERKTDNLVESNVMNLELTEYYQQRLQKRGRQKNIITSNEDENNEKDIDTDDGDTLLLERDTRISLTFRIVEKVMKARIFGKK